MNPLLYENIDKKKIILEDDYWFCIFDQFPVTGGHLLIIPKIKCENYFNLPEEYKIKLISFIDLVKDFMDYVYHPDGYNLGFNSGECAGQTVMQCHIHLIPRYINDMEDPRGGVRGVIPEKQKYN